MTQFALVLNPKTARPYVVRMLDGDTVVDFSSEKGAEQGNAYYDDRISITNPEMDMFIDSVLTSEITQLPRLHCPEGVRPQGIGLGVVLYYGAAVLARYTRPDRTHSGGGRGICTGHDANDEAKEWWRKAVKRGFAKKIKYRASDFRDKNVAETLKRLFPKTRFVGAYMTEESALQSGVVLYAHGKTYMKDIRKYLSFDYSRCGLFVKDRIAQILEKDLRATDKQLDRFTQRLHPVKRNIAKSAEDEVLTPAEMFPDMQDMD